MPCNGPGPGDDGDGTRAASVGVITVAVSRPVPLAATAPGNRLPELQPSTGVKDKVEAVTDKIKDLLPGGDKDDAPAAGSTPTTPSA
jgi:hypothetical protein